MKKISPIILIFIVALILFTLAACTGMKDDMKDEMTTLKDNATSMMDDMSSALGDMADDLTQGGNVTKDNGSTGLFDELTSDKASTSDKHSTSKPDESTTKGSTENNQ